MNPGSLGGAWASVSLAALCSVSVFSATVESWPRLLLVLLQAFFSSPFLFPEPSFPKISTLTERFLSSSQSSHGGIGEVLFTYIVQALS